MVRTLMAVMLGRYEGRLHPSHVTVGLGPVTTRHRGAAGHPMFTPHGSAKATKIESSCLNEIPLQMLPMGMWGPENMKIKKFRWGLFEFYIFLS